MGGSAFSWYSMTSSYGDLLLCTLCLEDGRFFWGFGFTFMSALIASSKLSGCNDTGLAFGMGLPPMAREKIQGQATFSYEQSQIPPGGVPGLRANIAGRSGNPARRGGEGKLGLTSQDHS